jgi:hypothetical protein
VADQSSDLFNNGRVNYEIGTRLILSGVIIRFDLTQGDNGAQTQLFITYPWSMIQLDRPDQSTSNAHTKIFIHS